jgi:DNA-binding beta-propeller fold protein YncE
MGMSWEAENVYWVFDGSDGSIVQYDFATDHGPGYDDHSDGVIARYVIGEVSRVKKVVSHIELDIATGLLYVADTGNNRVAVLDTSTGERGSNLSSIERGVKHYEMEGPTFDTLIDGATAGLEVPAGLALVGDLLLIGDNAQGKIHAFDLSGSPVGSIDTGLSSGSLMGFVANGLDEVWVTDVTGDRVLRIRQK